MKKSQTQADENLVSQLLERYNLQVERIPEGGTKTPDFLVSTSSGFCFYCEVKTIEGKPLSQPFLYKKANDRLKKDLDYASKKFRAVNAARLAPNVLAWVSHDQRIVALDDLILLIEGFRITPGVEGWAQPGFQFRKIVEYKTDIDLFTLIAKRGGPSARPSFLVNDNRGDFTNRLCSIFRL